VYREPATRFVAEFVGDNNVFDGVVTDSGDRFAVDGTATLPLPAGTDATAGEPVTVSIRPESITLRERDSPATDGEGSRIDGGDETTAVTREATVETVEYLGDAYRVHCRWDGRPVTVKTEGTSAPEGTASIGFDPEDVHVLSTERREETTEVNHD